MRLATMLGGMVLLTLLSGCATVPPAKQEVARDAGKEAMPGAMTAEPKQVSPLAPYFGTWKGIWRGTGGAGELLIFA